MNRLTISLVAFFICLSSFGQEKTKYRKLEYRDFSDRFGTNDTALAVIDIFFDKRDNAAYGQMSFLPITTVLIFVPNISGIGIATTAISLPIFLHGGYTLIRYRKKKLYVTLDEYNKNYQLPKWLRKKVNKQLAIYKVVERDY